MLTVEQAAQKAGVAVYKLREWIKDDNGSQDPGRVNKLMEGIT